MNVLITGGAGYLGSVLVEHLLWANSVFNITVLDNFMYGQASLAPFCYSPRLEIVRGDARDTRVIDPLLAKADVVFPLAAVVGAPACERDSVSAWSTNYDQVAHITKRLSKDQRIIFPTTNSGYGSYGGICTEDTPQNAVSVYGQTKVHAEQKVMEHENAISFRLATVFGASPRMRLDLLVNDFVFRAVYDRAVVLFEGHFARCFVHIRDVARCFEHAIRNFEALRGEAYNVGDSRANMTKAELCKAIWVHLREFVYMHAEHGEDPDKRNYTVSNAKIEAAGWKPVHTLDDGIKELIKMYQMVHVDQYRNA